jgi:hypothetical protein
MIAAVGAGSLALAANSAEGAPPKQPFDPNRITFEQGIERIKKVVRDRLAKGDIVTSRDEGMEEIVDALQTDNVPDGFHKYQLPVYFADGPGAQFFISVGQPKTRVRRHSHDEGDGFRFIASGSIVYNDKELRGGDWMFIPKGAPYSFSVGDQGAVICYCYQCCCA